MSVLIRSWRAKVSSSGVRHTGLPQADAAPFFQAMGLQTLPLQDEQRDYPPPFFPACAGGEGGAES